VVGSEQSVPFAGFLLVVRLALKDAVLDIDIAPPNSQDDSGPADVIIAAAGIDANENVSGNVA